MKRMLMMATTAAMIEQFNKNNILILEEMGYEVHILGNFLKGNPISDERLNELKQWIIQHHGKWFHYCATRNPADFKNNLKAYQYTLSLINQYHYEFIHCHTPMGSVIARMAAHRTHVKIIYTAHGFHFFKGAPWKNWILYYPVERFLSRWTDMLILINQEDYRRAKESFYAKQTKYIPGIGVDVNKFKTCQVDREKKCEKLGIQPDQFVLLSVGELSARKNQKLVIDALQVLKNKNISYLIVGKGDLKEEYEKAIHAYGLENNVCLLGYRTDVDELCKIADCFVHPSIREGLGIAPLEAMASGLPLISSDRNGMKDYASDGISGCAIDPRSTKQMCRAINKMYSDSKFREECAANNLRTVMRFDVKASMEIMKDIYREISMEKAEKHEKKTGCKYNRSNI